MKKIKLIVSDLHIGSGIHLPDGSRNTLEDFSEDTKFIEFIDHYGGYGYADHDVEIIVNGDMFNLLQVEVQNKLPDQITEEIAVRQMSAVINGHPEIFDALWTFCARPKNRLVFIVGNHDAVLLWSKVQSLLKSRIGPHISFYPDHYSVDGIFVAHGHLYEFIHHFNTTYFSYPLENGREVLRLPWGTLFILQFLIPLKSRRPYIDRIKPFRIYLKWAFWNDFRFFWRMIYRIIRFWLQNRFSSDQVRRIEFKLSISRISEAMNHVSLDEIAENILKNTHHRIVVFGHSHDYQYRTFGVHGEYFNTGTWTDMISLDVANLGRKVHRTYLLIEYDDQGHPKATLKRWRGIFRIEEDVRL